MNSEQTSVLIVMLCKQTKTIINVLIVNLNLIYFYDRINLWGKQTMFKYFWMVFFNILVINLCIIIFSSINNKEKCYRDQMCDVWVSDRSFSSKFVWCHLGSNFFCYMLVKPTKYDFSMKLQSKNIIKNLAFTIFDAKTLIYFETCRFLLNLPCKFWSFNFNVNHCIYIYIK